MAPMTYFSPKPMTTIYTALNSESSPSHVCECGGEQSQGRHPLDANPADSIGRSALNHELPQDGSVPDWIQLIPSGPLIEGRDNRWWKLSDPQAVIDESFRKHKELPGDWEHATEKKAPFGEPAPASFWMKEMVVRDGSIWARVEWTPKGSESVVNKEFRYISPVFDYRKLNNEISRISSAALTNKPNFDLVALNHENTQANNDNNPNPSLNQPSTEDQSMSLPLAICNALGLNKDASEESALNAINQIKDEKATALNHAENPSLEKFIPRAEYDEMEKRASNAEQKIKDQETEKVESEIESLVDSAIKAGKVTPANKDFYKAACRQENGMDEFKKFIESAPTIAGDSGLDSKDPNDSNASARAMNSEEKQIAEMFGNSAEDLAKFGK